MKILYLITKSNWGGAQKYVFDLALAMKDSGHDVVVAFGGQGILYDKLKAADIRTIKIEGLERDVDILQELKVFLNLYKIFKKENPHIVHLNSSKIGGSGSFIARLSGISKIVFTAHGWPFREERPLWQIILIKILSWLTILFSHKIICVSQKDFDDVASWPFCYKKLKAIHNGILIKEKVESSREQGEVKIVSIGELHKNKGFEYAIRAINILKDKIKNFKYTILTFGGEEKEKLENLIIDLHLEKFIEIYFLKKEEKASDMLENYDIYFMPSVKEGLPYVLLEAGLNSLPIVASDTGGINEIVDNYHNGFLIKPKDINAFELALEKLILDKELRLSFGIKSREKVALGFDIQKMIEKTRNIYKN
jgi:glycosyltransferase involved in cell wall biosynthesis